MIKLTTRQVARIKSLENAQGQLTAEQVVNDAKDKRSPLHVLFDWNLKSAAEKFWKWQAREIIGAVTVIVTNETTTIRSPVYVHSPDAKGYQSVATLRADPNQARESLIYTLEMASGHLRRGLDLAAPLGLQAQIDQLLAEVAGVQLIVRRQAA
jgi:hypothetical protein